MAVPEQTPYIEHTGNGATTSFALKFQCESKDHLIVLVDEIEPPIETWSLTGGNVVFTTAPAAGKKITLQRNTPFSRTTDYQSYNNSFRPPAVNKDFDWIWLKLQELGVADWILSNRINDLRAYVDKQDNVLQDNIDSLKNYVDDKDDELRNYLLSAIQEQGVALDQLEEYYSYLMQQLAQVAIDRGWAASFIVSADGSTQQQVNDRIGNTWYAKPLGYELNSRVMLNNGDIVKSTVGGNTNNPNAEMTGWVLTSNVYNVLTVADMLNLNLKGGDIVQVDSYLTPNLALAEPYVGGGLFKFNSALVGENDGGHVINGCVRQNIHDFNIENFGARLDGNINCTSAVNKACAALQAAGGGKLTVPKGVLLWGEQEFAGATGKGYSYKGKSLFEITGCTEPVTIELNATYIKLTEGLRYGALNPVTGLPHPSTGRFTDSDYRASIGSAFELTFNSKVMIKGAATLDFQQDTIQVGGTWGDTGIQIQSNGLRIYANVEGYAENIKILGAPLDGVYVGMPFSTGNYNYHYDKVGKVTLLNVESFKSGRQGFSHTGGFQGTFINCKFNETGMGKIASMPMAGIDIEPTAGAPCKELVFINCECAFNAGVGFLNYAKSEDVTWFGGKLIGTRNWTHWMQQDGGAVFHGTQFVGLGTWFGSTSQYLSCKFSDDISNYDKNPSYRGSWMMQNTQSALFKDCEYHTYRGRLVSVTDSPLFDGGIVYLHDIDENIGAGYMNLGSARIKSITVKDLRVNPQSARYSSNGVFLDSLSYAETSGNFRWGSSGGQKGGYRSPSAFSNYDGGKINGNLSRDFVGIATSTNIDKTTVNKIIPVSAIPTAVDESMYYKRGDLLLNTAATATSWTEAICITAGYTCNTAWTASTSVTTGSYVFVSNRVYKCVTAGTTGNSAPTGTGIGISDGTAAWDYLGSKAEFRTYGEKATSVSNATATDDTATKLNALIASLKNAGVIQ